jgi:serine/threonine-protein kinase RsbW
MSNPGETRVIELQIPSEFGFEKLAMKMAGAVAEHMGFAPDRVDALRTAVSEACLNAIEHGNQMCADTRVRVLLSIDANRLSIDVADEGRGGLPPGRFAEPDIDRKIAGQEELRRMGIHVIRQLVDEADFIEPGLGGGNRFRLVIHLERTE